MQKINVSILYKIPYWHIIIVPNKYYLLEGLENRKKVQKMKISELKATFQKSYYQKAFVLQDNDGNVYLQSYRTIVCGFVGGKLERYWDGYSRTTMNHLNDFMKFINMPQMNKKSWNDLKVVNCNIPLNEKVHIPYKTRVKIDQLNEKIYFREVRL